MYLILSVLNENKSEISPTKFRFDQVFWLPENLTGWLVSFPARVLV